MATSDYTELTKCVACDSQDLVETLDLGRQPLANDFLAPGSVLQEFPLKLVRCNACFHSQLSIAVDPARLFREYSYVSGTSDTLSSYFDGLTNDLISRFGKNKKILDIGSNDGSFLEKFVTTDWLALGVDPAVNLVKESAARGVTTIPAFYDEETADLLAKDFDVIVAMNVFAHTQNPLGILNGIQKNLAANGRAFIQTSQANMFKTGEFDTVYHEHISFFNVRSMKALLQRAGLYLANVSIVPIHGMSYLWEVSKIDNQDVKFERENEEVNFGVYNPEVYHSFTDDAFKKAAEVHEIISEYRSKGYKVVSYGAAAKGNTFINFAKLEFDYILDDTPQKISKMSPAGGCVVSNPNVLSQIQGPIFVVIPAWNFRSEIIAKIRLNRGVEEDFCLTYFPETLIEKL